MFSKGIGWYLQTTLMYMQIYMYATSVYFFQTPNGILSLNNWQYLGFVYDNQTGKYLSIFSLDFLPSLITIVHISLISELMSIYTELSPPYCFYFCLRIFQPFLLRFVSKFVPCALPVMQKKVTFDEVSSCYFAEVVGL
jgi:hypothetical protein